MERYFQLSFNALILAAFVALAGTGRVDFPAILVFLIGFGIVVRREMRGLRPLLTPRAAFLMSAAYIFFFILDALVLSRSFVSAILHMVLFLELAKLGQEKSDKDYLYLIILAFLQVLAASSLTIDMSFVVTLFFFLIALVSTLMSFDIVRSQRKDRAYDGPLLDGPLGGMSVWATLWIIVIGIGLFFLIPRTGTGYFSRAAAQTLLISGFTENVELGEIGEVKRSSALVMRTRILNGTSSVLPKWRGIALDTFDGRGWSKSPERRRQVARPAPDQYRLQNRFGGRPPEGTVDAVRFEVFLEPLATNALFGPHSIRQISGDFRRGLEQDSLDSVYQRTPAARRIRYEVASEIPVRHALGVGVREDASLADTERYLQLPDDLDPRIVSLAEMITSDAVTTIEKASLVETYLKREYAYSLDLTWDPGDSPLSTFLFDVRSGHCEYFASSMAIMLRAVGIPTRMVNGFLPGEYNAIGRSYIIRQYDAHSWVEVYVPGRGWIDFDPTPPDPNRGDVSLITLITHYMDAADLFWNSYVLTYDSDTQFQLFRSARDMAQALQQSFERRSNRWVASGEALSDRLGRQIRRVVESPAFWWTLGTLVLAGLGIQHRRRLKIYWKVWRVRHRRDGADSDVVGEMFYRATLAAGIKKNARSPHETWREWTQRVPDKERRGLITVALGIFEEARYGGRAITAEQYTQLEDTLQRLKNA